MTTPPQVLNAGQQSLPFSKSYGLSDEELDRVFRAMLLEFFSDPAKVGNLYLAANRSFDEFEADLRALAGDDHG